MKLGWLACGVGGLALIACSKTPEPQPNKPEAQSETKPVVEAKSAPTESEPAAPSAVTASPREAPGKKGDDPMRGEYTLAQATEGLEGKGALVATISTSKGELKCTLFDDKAPVTVANFVGLATGKRPFRDPKSREWVTRPAYDGTTFHRIIKGFMIQGGDARGDGTGEPGYVIKDEIWPGAKHDRAGLLCMANRGPNTNGAQFFITDASTPHLDAGYTIFGECSPVTVVHDIASVATGPNDRPETDVVIKSVRIGRSAKGK